MSEVQPPGPSTKMTRFSPAARCVLRRCPTGSRLSSSCVGAATSRSPGAPRPPSMTSERQGSAARVGVGQCRAGGSQRDLGRFTGIRNFGSYVLFNSSTGPLIPSSTRLKRQRIGNWRSIYIQGGSKGSVQRSTGYGTLQNNRFN